MPPRKLDSYVSGQIARTNPLEGGPAFEAWRNGTNVMASTWGDYVSRLGENLGSDVPLPELLGKLCITEGDLADPKVHFAKKDEFRDYQHCFMRTTHEEAERYFDPEVKRLQTIVDAIADGYRVPDRAAAKQEADKIQEEIREVSAAFRDIPNPTDEEYQEDRMAQGARCMRRDALTSGTVIPLNEFVATMLSVNLLHDPDFKSELAHVWLRSLARAIESFQREWNYDWDMSTDRMVVGAATFNIMRTSLAHLYEEQEAHRQQRWREVEPVFITHFIDQHPLVTGQGEK